MNDIKQESKLATWFINLLLLLVAYIIYTLQIEKSFNLISVYCTILVLHFSRSLSGKYHKYLLPVAFVGLLYYLYPGFQFIAVFATIVLLLVVLLPNYSLRIKIPLLFIIGIGLSLIYILPNTFLHKLHLVPFIAGSLFMFRSISYIHEMRYTKNSYPLIDKLNYFLLLPNLSMPLFPIVDFKLFASSYTDANYRSLRRGMLFIIRGIIQLLLYRFIYHYIVEPVNEIQRIDSLLIYIASNFLLVLRVIGAYHIAMGSIELCGYHVPDLFNNVFLASGFTDLWRRTNIYWKDFITKIFYYPIYFRLKKKGVYIAIIITTLICFAITWLLHNYQWFWIKGTFPLQVKDIIFWGIFGVLVAIGSLRQQYKIDYKHDKNIVSKNKELLLLSINSLLVFLSMSFLWSIWISPDINSWFKLLTTGSQFTSYAIVKSVFICLIYLCIAFIYQYYQKLDPKTKLTYHKRIESASPYLFLACILPLLIAQIVTQRQIKYGLLIKPIISEKLNKADQQNIDNGYYSNLINTNDYCTQVWSSEANINKRRTKYINQQVTRMTNDLMLCTYIPNKKIDIEQIKYSINSAGFHDKEYSYTKPSSVYRIIVLGGSYESGNGVNDNEDFISVVEADLEKNYYCVKGNDTVKVEIINMAVNGYMLLQRMYLFKKHGMDYEPDATLLFLHSNYRQRMVNYLARLLYNNNHMNDAYVAGIIKQCQINKSDNESELSKKLGSYPDSINEYAIRSIHQMAIKDSITFACVYLPALKDKSNDADLVQFETFSKRYRFPLLHLENVYADHDKKALSISELDFHPNKISNDLIAKKLSSSIIENSAIFGLKMYKK